MKSQITPLLVLIAASLSSASPLSILLPPICPTIGLPATRAAQVRAAFQSSGIIPDIFTSINPTTELQVLYGNIPENLGNTFSAAQTLQEPIISFPPEALYPPSTKYTYIQLDPDAPGPSLPLLRSYLHHIIYNLQPSCVFAQSPVIQARYMPLTPLSVAPHRYVSLLFRQPAGEYKPPALNLIEDVARAPFDLAAYVQQAGLVLVGGNFMREGLGSSVCALVPGCTSSGVGYVGAKNGTALRTDLLSGILNLLPVKE
ncbi:26 kDa secreted antigen [Colletotrichum fructicola Nara gc5]|uniref:26 kDa secreted antigen n=1 Tax=Colletotrichum fructicola (strain Nara gc5) TaxID=1213859 RepID=L2G520_COLFN|nr:26 kDa secreted antigen [Colletotrichum fructicola Nara gc5]KAF5504592.1 26 kDa secreted antigen [Colletotrichum fructicola]